MADVTLQQIRRRLTGLTPSKISEPGLIDAAVAVILTPLREAGVELLLIKRADRPGDTWSGQMAFPGGRWESGDADLLRTAIRETMEETGIDLKHAELLAELDDLRPRIPSLPPVRVRPFVFAVPTKPVVRPSSEVASILWTGFGTLLSSVTKSEVNVRGVTRAVLGYRVGGELVWGMTERIITPLLELVAPIAR